VARKRTDHRYPPAAPPTGKKRFPGWAVGVLTAVLASAVTAVCGAVVLQLFNVAGAKDAIRDAVPQGPAPAQGLPAPQNGTGLRITLLGVQGADDGRSVSFPTANVPAARKFIDATLEPPFLDMLAAGGYSDGSLQLRVSLEGLRNEKISVHDVKVTGLSRQDIPTGAIVNIPGQGEPADQMSFRLDEAHPAAHEVRDHQVSTSRYFDSQFIELAEGEKKVLVIGFDAMLWAYSFDVTIAYEIGGRLLTQTIPRIAGQPYRVAGSACYPAKVLASLSEADHKRLGALRYAVVSSMAEVVTLPNGHVGHRMDHPDPARYCQH
jgi:hypothetical protein